MIGFPGYDIAIAIIAIMLAVGGIIYGVGYALDDRKLKEFGRAELYQSVINGVLVGALVAAFAPNGIVIGVINTTTNSTTSAKCDPALGYNTAICFAYTYLSGITVNVGNSTYPSLLSSTSLLLGSATLLYLTIGSISSINVNLIFISFGLSGLKFALGPLQEMIDILVTGTIAIIGQAALLRVIAIVAIPVLLPIGLVLRSLYFTRRLGGTIVAIAVGLFAVYPMTYLLGAQLLSSFASGQQGSVYATTGLLNSTTYNAEQFGIETVNQTDLYQGRNTLNSTTNVTGQSVYGSVVQSTDGFAGIFSGALSSLETAVAFLIVQVFLLPVLSIVLTLVSIRELARILGTEVTFGRFDLF